MQHETTAVSRSNSDLIAKGPQAWRQALALLICSSLALVYVTAREWGEMFHQWWNIDTYAHVLLVPVLVTWLVGTKKDELSRIEPKPWLPGIAVFGAALLLWLAGRILQINLLAHAGAVAALQGMVIAILGTRVSLVLALPIAFGAFLVPFGDEIIPPLQLITARIAIALTELSGIPAEIDGIYIDTPVGMFIVAEACSGVKFLVAMIALGVLVCFTRFDSWKRRIAFMTLAVLVPIVANGIRAWGTIYIAQSQGVDFAAGFDHIFYGWIFFAIVVTLLLTAAWPFFERRTPDHGLSAAEASVFLSSHGLERGAAAPTVILGAIAVLLAAAAVSVAIVEPATLV